MNRTGRSGKGSECWTRSGRPANTIHGPRHRWGLAVLVAVVLQGVVMGQQPPAQPAQPAAQPQAQPQQPARPADALSGKTRLPVLGIAPKPDVQTLEKYKPFVQEVVDPDNTLDLIQGRPRLIILKQVPVRVQIANPDTADWELITDRELSVLGKEQGTTVLNLWFTDPQDPNRQIILSYLVRVLPDPGVRERLEQIYKALEAEINQAFPDSWVCLALVGDKLVVSGQAKDVAEAAQILRIVSANAPTEEQAQQLPLESAYRTRVNEELGGLLTPGLADYLVAGSQNVINLLRIPGEQQVNLKVTVAEVNRAAARSIGMNFSLTNNDGLTYFSHGTGGLLAGVGGGGGGIGGGGGGLGFGLGGLGSGLGFGLLGGQGGQGGLGGGGLGLGAANIVGNLDNGQVRLAINALRSLGYARTLAEPNLTTLNGQPAQFLAGGQFPIPIVTGFTAAGLQGVAFVPFGVQLSFTPYITDRDRIRITVSANVSTRDVGAGSIIAGAAVPGLTTRTFMTTVELREGQTLAIAGLIQNNLGANADRIPLLGDLPIFGNLWKFDRLTAGEQELVVLITPELVHPLEPKEVPPLPGSDLFEPGDLEFYVLGRLESRRSYDYRSPVMNDLHRMWRYRQCENLYILGPHGHSESAGMPVK
ncbi:MAG: pilus assembly protein N-terminal domain-containing protein [Gemmatales bacterium]|nr:pilus assembly protein N-terminal domain-containing protein [Gemmatales bacterium]MDW8387858.1 pilus assembly protein N-terminal domain-containing protein [Gemmatales bacterium]